MSDSADVSRDITTKLRAWSGGDQGALESLIPCVEHELRRVARRCLNGKRGDPILETTALINEAFLRLIGGYEASWQDRVHFFAVCSQIMRRILVDQARARRASKRGGDQRAVSFDEALAVAPGRNPDLVAIDDALEALEKVDPRKARVVELRFFGGLTVEESADVLKVSPETVKRDWRLAKAWLLREMGGEVTR